MKNGLPAFRRQAVLTKSVQAISPGTTQGAYPGLERGLPDILYQRD